MFSQHWISVKQHHIGENNRDEPDVDIPESGKIPLYSVCPVYGISDTIFYFRIGHHTGTVWRIMYAVVMCIELYYIIYFMLYLFIKLTCIKLFNNIFSVVTHDYCCVSTFYFNKVWINTSGVI